jgi:hypothetical protein
MAADTAELQLMDAMAAWDLRQLLGYISCIEEHGGAASADRGFAAQAHAGASWLNAR